jgi:prostaglandin-endoperoxide synthase 2
MLSINRFGSSLISGYPWFWQFVTSIPPLRRWINQFFINYITSSAMPRPYPLSLWGPGPNPSPGADYTSWTGLVDRTYTGRHLKPASAEYISSLPPTQGLAHLFARGATMTPCPKSSALFGFFAQWFTDSFLRTDPNDLRRNTSNHEIDLCQIYGLNAADTALIRSGKGGELKTQLIDGQEFPPFLFKSDGSGVQGDFINLSYIDPKTGTFKNQILDQQFDTPARKAKLFVTGLERGNSTIFYSALNTIFTREHNRLCRELARRHPEWANDDDRLFETARNINIACLLKVIVEDYINHLSSAQFKVFVEVGFAEQQNWYRTNRICAEFDILYRWHPLVPTQLALNGSVLSGDQFRYNNDLLLTQGIETIIGAAAGQRAGRIMLNNTAPFLVSADLAALEKSRTWRLQPYNAYRSRFGLKPVHSFEELTGDRDLAAKLKATYGDVDRVEFLVGLLAERRDPQAMLGDLMSVMVAVDAFSQALTNPLLSQNVYGKQCFSDVGLETLANTASLDDIVRRNAAADCPKATFEFAQAPPGAYRIPVVSTVLDTIDFLFVSGWEQFFRRRQRKYASTVFKANLFQPTTVVLDHQAIVPLFASDDLVQDYGFSWAIPPRPLVGNVAPSIFEAGPAHDRPKALYLHLLQKRAPSLATTFHEVAGEFTNRWVARRQFAWCDELEDFAVRFLFRWILGASPEPKDVRDLYNNIFTQFAAPITKYIPWSSYSRSVVIYERLLAFVKSSPGFPEILALAQGVGLTDTDAVAKQILFLLGMNSFLGNQNLFKSIVGELSLRPDLCRVLREEIAAVLGPQPGPVDLHKLVAMPMLDKTLREILRLHPPVFFIFGRATRDRFIESASGRFAIAKGELVMGVIALAHRDDKMFVNPDRFDPNRFDDPAASQHLIWPRGLHDSAPSAHDRTCPGKDVAILTAKLFCSTLLSGFTWKLKDPQPQWDHRQYSLNVAAPKGSLDVAHFGPLEG